jgi:acetylornithine deacetylase/succinyl-diaminopimelate desuccinylase-like protein
VWLHLVTDEEVVGRSTRELLTRLPRVDAVIDAEPTELSLMPVEGGLIHLRIEVDGVESHAGNRYTLLHPGEAARGVSAIDKLLKILAALAELERQWAKKPPHPMLPPGFATIMPGILVGGPGGGSGGRLNVFSNAGTVPNYAAAEYNIWYLPSETFEDVRAEIEHHVHHAAQLDPWLAEHPPRLTWKLNGIFFPPADTPPDHPLIRAFEEALGALRRPAPVIGFNAASELAWYAEHGIPGTLFGPGAIAQAHGCDEFVPIEDVVAAAQAIALAILRYAGPAR